MEQGQVKTTDTTEAVGAESTTVPAPEAGKTMDTAFEEEGGPNIGTAVATPPEVDWAKYGLESFKGRPPEEVANFLKLQFRNYGKQANELGELRRKAEEYEKLKSQITGQQQTAPAKQAMAQMDELELAHFAEAFNQNPYAAIEKFIVPKLEESLTNRVFGKVEEKFKPVLESQSEELANKQEFATFAREHTDYQKYSDVMKMLMTDDYVGENVEFSEAYNLAVLADKEQSLFNDTCKAMKHGFSFDEAKEYASLKQSAASTAVAKTEQVKKEVVGAAVGGKRTATKQAASEPAIKTMDEAFNP